VILGGPDRTPGQDRSEPPRIRLVGITKRYGALLANDGIDLTIARGEIHAIVGENGAGKTTLMRILYGMVRPDAGTIEIDGAPTDIADPAMAIQLGIGMVHQRFQLVDELTAVENLVLGRVPCRFGPIFDRRRALAEAEQLAATLGTRMPWMRPVRDLGVGDKQRLEIIRLLYHRADVLIFDEPTGVLTPQEAAELFAVLRRLAAAGRTIVFISHKLGEVLALADTITVVRRGRIVWSGGADATDAATLATFIVGQQLEARTPLAPAAPPGDEALRVAGLSVADDHGRIAIRGAAFAVRAREIVGIAGVEGSGQQELVEALVGLRRVERGTIAIDGVTAPGRVRERRPHGLAYVPADRDQEGACLPATLTENLLAGRQRRPEFRSVGILRWDVIRHWAADLLERFEIRGGGPRTAASSLSGGNLQRVVVARELGETPRLLIAAHPTRGVDVRGAAFIHRQLAAARDAGAAILLVSAELDELLALADRLLVLFDGRIVAELPASAATPDRLGALMTGLAA
jgi:general nucleoside transport system ATP-binding protein